ncbi:MAG: hypothetical protein UR79_C0003G0032 [Candidatus Campbellbacteria bacterium GW2011_GWD1_35_49]|nr:MAG: hypothetical protein UR74_C0003G0029 [Candidatus Campbellbacteria bacterium GW2011_GWD2_35_24]KKP76751.1 MAG: hypothetical protein UR76_C0003G0029 [Candidatus Campbellbacteria bacterium GW2011_GWC1_35_31]KKP78678.1 MAG: hypothetical protein UR79_C0003G0032 [Candidatus Campbellbacteria bacterium GW2011_GWD1_35_49]
MSTKNGPLKIHVLKTSLSPKKTKSKQFLWIASLPLAMTDGSNGISLCEIPSSRTIVKRSTSVVNCFVPRKDGRNFVSFKTKKSPQGFFCYCKLFTVNCKLFLSHLSDFNPALNFISKNF